MPIECDYHMHTPLCHHATGPMEAYVERGCELGLREIGFADHNPLPDGRGANVRMAESELDYYVERVHELKYRYRGKIDVLLGIELDYVPGLEDYLQQQLARYPWDYVIGSVHYFDADCRIGSWTRTYDGTADEQYARYFELVRQLAGSGLCDIIAHVDVVKRAARPITPRFEVEMAHTLEAIRAAGICMEINTSGYRHPELGEPQSYPSLPWAARVVQLGIPLTVNSDAHAPEQVGTMFPVVENFLRQHGGKELCRFAGRQRTTYAF